MQGISVLILTKNNEDTIEKSLQSVRGADEIVIIDSLSTDRTLEICQKYTTKIYQQEWLGFSRQRNVAIAKASYDWIFFLDSDEVVEAGVWEEVLEIVSSSSRQYDVYSVPQLTYFLGCPLRHGGWMTAWPHLYRTAKAHFDENKTNHEGSAVPGESGILEGMIHHYSFPDMKAYFEKFDRYTTLDAKQMQVSGLTKRNRLVELKLDSTFSVLKFLFWDPVLWFGRRFLLLKAYKDGVPGLIYAIFGAFNEFVGRVKYLEMKMKERRYEGYWQHGEVNKVPL